MANVYYGIDLGTSSSSISYIVESPRMGTGAFIEPTTVKFQPPPGVSFFHTPERVPSIVSVEQKGTVSKIFAGFAAREAAGGKRAKPFQNLFMSAKSDMGTLKIYEDSVRDDLLTPVEVSAEIIRELIRAAEKETGVSPKKARVVITVPASFTHNQRQDTLDAARFAGLTIADGDLLDEPVAAFIHTACHQKLDAQLDMTSPKRILIFDLGAGTCDVSVFEASYAAGFASSGIGLDIVNRSISNYEKLGGDNVDLHIVELAILPHFCEKNRIDFDELPERVKREIRFRLKLKARQVKEEICRQIRDGRGMTGIKQPWAIDSFPISEQNTRTAKVTGTTKLETFLELMHPFIADDLESSYTIADDYCTYSFFGPVIDSLRKAGLGLGDVDGFIFNGGSCHNPIIRRAFKDHGGLAGATFFETPDLDLSVSKGAAIHCYYLHRNSRPLVTPILNSDIGIYTHGLKKEVLIPAGTSLPFPEGGDYRVKNDFCLPRAKMNSVGISVFSGDGRVVSNLKLPLPEGVKKGDPVSIGVRIDSNKVMSFTAFMSDTPDVRIDAELSNPWTHTVNTPEDMAANELWEKVASTRRERQNVPAGTMIDLANRERLRNNVDAALEIMQRLEDRGTSTPGFHNILALCYARRGQRDKALEHFRKAAEMAPDNATLVSNYGSELVNNDRVDEGISVLRRAVDIGSGDYFPHYWLGYAYRGKGDEESAGKEFLRARKILVSLCCQHPDNEVYTDFLQDVELAIGNYAESDAARRRLQAIRNSKILGGDQEDLLAGPESGIWTEDEIYENKERE